VPTIHQRVAEGRSRLRQAGLSSAEADISARALAEHLLGWTTERFLADAVEAEPHDFAARFDAVVARRAAREPLAYIVGVREFWGLSIEVTPDVLIPRPETELIVEAALDLHPDREAPLSVVDACTGSGCVALAIATERPHASIVATDISEAALIVARRNARRHDVFHRIRFVATDLLFGVDGPFDLVVANPPYVRDGDRRGLQPEVQNEPSVALYGGTEGLDPITRLLADAPPRLVKGGHLVFEFGLGQEIEVEHLIAQRDSLSLIGFRRDLQGIARTAVVRRVA
jgi:release factor glutamine methyltransferase